MKIPLNWLKEFVNLPKSQKELTDKLTMAGHMLDKVDKVNGNIVIDLELRGNRADCYSIIGIAREVAALFNTKVRYSKEKLKLKKVKKIDIDVNINTKLVNRVMAVEIKNIKIAKSPKWLSERLKEYGMESINNIVDLTNYVMLETGQPMHAFDKDLIGNSLEIRLAKDKEQMVTFLGKNISLDTNDLVWSNGPEILSIAGAIGGKAHSISAKTKNILLEAANYDRANVRRSIYKHKLLTEAGIRHEKDLDPNMVEIGIQRFLELIEKNKWGKAVNKVYDFYPKPKKSWKVTLNYNYMSSLSGLDLDKKQAIKILKSLNFKVSKNGKSEIEVLVPTYRTDVTLEEDVIEEILRIYGYDKIPQRKLSLEIPKIVTPKYISEELEIKNIMTGLGFDEVISSTFVKENYLIYNRPVVDDNYEAVKILNRPSPDNEFLRMSLFPNLLENTRKIINERGTLSQLFEIGKVYLKKKNNYTEEVKLGIIYYQKDSEFVHFKGYVESLFEKLNIPTPKYEEIEQGYKILSSKDVVGFGFEFENIFFTEINLDSIINKSGTPKAHLWPKYPPQIEDITFTFPQETKIGEVISVITGHQPLVNNFELIDTYKDSYTFRIVYLDPKKTLTDKEVEKIREKILKEVREKFGGSVKN